MLLNCGVGEDSWESPGLQRDPISPSYRRSVLGVHWKDWYWRWNSNTLATSCEELSHLKRPWSWEKLRAEGEGDDRGWDGCMVSLTQWTWVWVGSGSWLWTGRPGMLRFIGSQRIGHKWAAELNWTDPVCHAISFDVQERLTCCSPLVAQSDTNEWLNWTDVGIINIWFLPNWNQTKTLHWSLCLHGWTHCWPLPSSVFIKYLIHTLHHPYTSDNNLPVLWNCTPFICK